MSADHFFAIGRTHKVCEDYARSGSFPDKGTFAVVADGCSSSPDTDFGSRFLSMTAIECLSIYGCIKPEWVAWRTKDRVTLPLSTRCLDATLLALYVTKDRVYVSVTGDGVVIVKHRDGDTTVYDFDYEGAPGYLSYLLDPSRMGVYLGEGYGKRTITAYRNGSRMDITEQEIVSGDPDTFHAELVLGQPEMVMVCTDGVHSFLDADHDPVPMLDVIEHLVAIKSCTGEFVQRRLRRFLTKTCPSLGWSHGDDLGVAAIYVPYPEGE